MEGGEIWNKMGSGAARKTITPLHNLLSKSSTESVYSSSELDGTGFAPYPWKIPKILKNSIIVSLFFAGILRQKDVEQALIYEEKIALLLKLLSSVGVDIGMEPPSYCHLVSEYLDNDTVRKEVFNTIQVCFLRIWWSLRL